MFEEPIFSNDWLVKRMQLLGYKVDSNGICFGLSNMGMQAYLALDTAPFEKRFKDMHEYEENFFLYAGFLLKKAESKELPDEEKKFLELFFDTEIFAFFDAVEAYQNPRKHPNLFNPTQTFIQDTLLIEPFTRSKKLEEQGGITKAELSFAGSYSKEELEIYFKSLSSTIEDTRCANRISLILSCSNHTITVGYNPLSKKWFFLNPASLPARPILSIKEIAEAVHSALHGSKEQENGAAIFSTQMFATQKNRDALAQVSSTWQKQKEWVDLHKLSSEKINKVDRDGTSLLFLATQNQDLNEVKTLLKEPHINLYPQRESRVATPLFMAVCTNNFEIVKLLLQSDKDPSRTIEHIKWALNYTEHTGSKAIITLLKNALFFCNTLNDIKDNKSEHYQVVCRCYSLYLAAENDEKAKEIVSNTDILDKCHRLFEYYDPQNDQTTIGALKSIKECVLQAYSALAQHKSLQETVLTLREKVATIGDGLKKPGKTYNLPFFKPQEKSEIAEDLYNIIQKILYSPITTEEKKSTPTITGQKD